MTEFEDVFDMYSYVNDIDFPELSISNYLILYIWPALLILGTFGNIFSVIIMSKLCNEVLSTCVYLAISAVLDTSILCTRCGNEWLVLVAEMDLTKDISSSSNIACKVYPFVFNFILHMYRWLIVCVSIEAFIVVRFPDKMSHMCSLSRSKAVILLITVLLICINIHYFWTHEKINPADYDLAIFYGDKPTCLGKEGVKQGWFASVIKPITDLLVTDVLPISIVATFSVLTVVYMCEKSRNKDTKEEEKAWRKRYLLYPYAFKRIKIAALVICIMFLITHLPSFVLVIFQYIEANLNVETSIRRDAQTLLAKTVCDMLQYIFSTVKFYIYFITCKQFRDEFYQLFRRMCQCFRRSPRHEFPKQEVPLMLPASNSCCHMHRNVETFADSHFVPLQPGTVERNFIMHTNV